MFRVRKEQMAEFERRARLRFERVLADHLQEEFPDKCAEIGDEAVASVVTWAIDHGRDAYGFITEEQVSLFACVPFLLTEGLDIVVSPSAPPIRTDFETARELRWAKQALDDPDNTDADLRISALYDAIAREKGEEDEEEDEDEASDD